MAGTIGDSARYTPPKALLDDLKQIGKDIDDLSPAMQRGSQLGSDDVAQRLDRGGDGNWPALAESTIKRHGDHKIGVGEAGGFGPTLRRDWSKKNFVVFTKEPHAHLFGEGRNVHYSTAGKKVNVFNERTTRVRGDSKGQTRGGGHVSKAESRKRLLDSTSVKAQPAREFMYFSEEVFTKFRDVLFDHVFGALGK